RETLDFEKELLGFYVSGHPLDDYAGRFEDEKISFISEAINIEEKEKRESKTLGGIILSVEKKYTKSNKPFVILSLEDFTAPIEIFVWDEVFSRNAELLTVGNVVSAKVGIQRQGDKLRVSATSFKELKKKATGKPVILQIQHALLTDEILEKLQKLARKHSGKRPLQLEVQLPTGETCLLQTGSKFSIGDEYRFRQDVEEQVGILPKN
ncbi:MAG: OB-fold nucleic acid binding domain-containing protein, partial [Chthoniobacterales bacterium]